MAEGTRVALDGDQLGSNSSIRRKSRSPFFVGMSVAVLFLVVAGFGRTLYFRDFFDVPAAPTYLIAHGVLMTIWFVWFVLQTTLVERRRVDLHRQAGFIGVGLGVAIVILGVMVTPGIMPTLTGDVDVDANLRRLSGFVWADFGLLLSFSVFLTAAVYLRRRPEFHRRLMMLTSISLLAPALARIGAWPIFGGVNRMSFALGLLLALLTAVAIHDLISTKRLHIVTVIGGSFFVVVRISSTSILPASDFGMSFTRWLLDA